MQSTLIGEQLQDCDAHELAALLGDPLPRKTDDRPSFERRTRRIARTIDPLSDLTPADIGAAMREHVITVSPYIRPDGTKHPNAFDARLAGSDAVLCVSETPLLSSARALLAAGMAGPDDTIVMRHAGSDFDALRARVGAAAGLRIKETGSAPALRKYEAFFSGPGALRIAQTSSLAPDHSTRPQTLQRPGPTVLDSFPPAPKGVKI